MGAAAQAGAADPNAAAGQAAQGQWASDPSSYYSNYWGGKSSKHSYCCPSLTVIAQVITVKLRDRVQMGSIRVLHKLHEWVRCIMDHQPDAFNVWCHVFMCCSTPVAVVHLPILSIIHSPLL